MNQLLAMRAFVRVVETGSFSQAANHLALPRSTVSKLVSDLESHLGIKLLNRTTRAVAATNKPIPLEFEKAGERFTMSESDYAANDGNGLMAMLLAGLGVGQHFQRCVQPHLDSGELVPVLTEWNRSGMPFHILYPPNRHQSARLKVFIEWLLATFGDEPGAS